MPYLIYNTDTVQMHNVSNSLVNARLIALFSDKALYAKALGCFYYVFVALEAALDEVWVAQGSLGDLQHPWHDAAQACIDAGPANAQTHRLSKRAMPVGRLWTWVQSGLWRSARRLPSALIPRRRVPSPVMSHPVVS